MSKSSDLILASLSFKVKGGEERSSNTWSLREAGGDAAAVVVGHCHHGPDNLTAGLRVDGEGPRAHDGHD